MILFMPFLFLATKANKWTQLFEGKIFNILEVWGGENQQQMFM